MTRKLLPYEYELIDVLGISTEEYLDFVAQQHIYEDIKEGTALDIQNTTAVVALVLTIIGTLFQVASILLMPKPPGAPEGSPQTRDQRLAPRTGFNGAQQLAVYGETVPLVYTSMNAHTANSNDGFGGVRVSTLLLWSAILSFGNSQFMQLMMTIGAATIKSIDPARTAIGQLPAQDIVLSNVWQYFNENGPTTYNNLVSSGPTVESDPTFVGRTTATAILNKNGLEGFSQCFSPTTANAVGVTGFIPVNAKILTLTKEGDIHIQNNAIRYDLSNTTFFTLNQVLTLTITDTIPILLTTDIIGNARQAAKRAAASLFDNGAIFKTGSALFRVNSVTYAGGKSTLDEGALTVRLQCIQPGNKFSFDYGPSEGNHYLDNQGSRAATINNTLIPNLNADNAAINRQLNEQIGFVNSINNQLETGRVTGVGGAAGQEFFNRAITAAERTNLINQKAALEARITSNNAQIAQLNNELANTIVAPFHTKGFARIEMASYASVTKCNVLDLALKCDVFRRISGRNNVYGSKQRDYNHTSSDNGAKARTAMFKVKYRFVNTDEFATIPFIFCARGVNEQSVFTFLKLVTTVKHFIEVRLEPVIDPPTENRAGYCYLEPNGGTQELTTAQTGNSELKVFFKGSKHITTSNYPPINRSPKDTSEFDLFNYDAYTNSTFSFDNGPEIKITAVNEQTIESWGDYSKNKNGVINLYKSLTNFALHLHSGSGTQDVRDVSVWVKEGKLLRPLNPGQANNYVTAAQKTALKNSAISASSSYAPDIFLDTVIDTENGIGRFASLHSVDVRQLALSKRFCIKNKFFMDGLIGDARSWREFWAQVAPFSLLELGKIGGMDTLVPAVPYDEGSGAITRNVVISALFNQGNILEGTYKEEFIDYGASTQDVLVTVIFRNIERGGIFPRNASVQVRLRGTLEADTNAFVGVRETIDASQFVTTRNQALVLGKFLCQVRHHSRRAIEFQTFPTDSFVMPGKFIYVETSNNQWQQIYTGRIEAGGVLNVPITGTVPNGTYSVLTYGNSTDGSGTYADGTQSFTGISVSNNTATSLASKAGQLFVLGTAVRSKRVFRITEVSMEEEGETTVRAVEHPCDSNGNSLIAEGLTAPSNLFNVDGVDGG